MASIINGETGDKCERGSGGGDEREFGEDFNDEPMFPPQLLLELEFGSERSRVALKQMSDPLRPAPSLFVRPLTTADYYRGFVSLLSQLTTAGDVTEDAFLRRYRQMVACRGNYYVIVVEDRSRGKLAATGTLVVEQKFVHSCACRGRVEDIVVSDEYRGKQLGKVVVECLRLLGVHLGCYKTSLECTHALLPFYEQFGFSKDGENNYVVQRYKD